MGMLDVAPAGAVNGPEDDILDWDAINWRAVEDNVRRLRQRIFTASQAGDLKRVRNLQRLMLRSRANALLSVRRVTEINAGRKTAGVDGKLVLLPEIKAELAGWAQRHWRRGHPDQSSACSYPRPTGNCAGWAYP
jgi:RNA-directed DNA polymerase